MVLKGHLKSRDFDFGTCLGEERKELENSACWDFMSLDMALHESLLQMKLPSFSTYDTQHALEVILPGPNLSLL